MALPALLWVAVASAVAVVVLHALSWRRPRPRPLPTARFVPASSPASRFRRVEFSDLGVMTLRLLALGLLGLAAAGAVGVWRSASFGRVIVVDQSRAVARVAEVADSVARLTTQGATTRLVLLDSAPRVLDALTTRSDSALGTRRGNLAAALIMAVREAVQLRLTVDSVELVIVSPLVKEEVNGAIAAIVRAWGGPVRLVRVSARKAVAPPDAGGALPLASDPLGAAARTAWGSSRPQFRLQRAATTDADRAFARSGGTLVVWPALTNAALEMGSASTRNAATIGRFRWSPDTVVGTPIAWREDGRPVAGEVAVGQGCVRTVHMDVPDQGDAALRPSFVALVRDLTRPCGAWDLEGEDATLLTAVQPAAASAPPTESQPSAWLQRLLLTLALFTLGVEGWLRNRRHRSARSPLVGPVTDATS